MTKHNYTWFCHECDEKISIPSVDSSGEDCCPTCESTNLSPIFHCVRCGYELDDHRDLCDVCEADRYPQPIEIMRWRTPVTHFIHLRYPDIEIVITKKFRKGDTEISVDGDMVIGNMIVETYCKKKPTTRREVRKAIAEIHQLHAKLKGSKL